MKCTRIELPNGGAAIICGPKPRSRRCTACGCPTTPTELRECDFDVGGKTCDRLICIGCSISPAPDVDYCPEHAVLARRAHAGSGK